MKKLSQNLMENNLKKLIVALTNTPLFTYVLWCNSNNAKEFFRVYREDWLAYFGYTK